MISQKIGLYYKNNRGAVAQLARAIRSHRIGRGFDSLLLHQKIKPLSSGFYFLVEMKPSGFASCLWALDTPEACKAKGASCFAAEPQSASWREAPLHLPHSPLRLAMKHCSALAPQYEAAPLRFAMKPSRFASKVYVVFAKPSAFKRRRSQANPAGETAAA